MNITIEVDARRAREALLDLRRRRVPRWRRRLTEHVAREVLRRTIQKNPVETGRARSAWAAALEQLGGVPPAGWQGGQADRGAISEGADAQSTTVVDSAENTQIAVENGVEYVVYLEYGTRKMSAFHMAQQSLAEAPAIVAGDVPRLFEEGGG
jgi:hypothetical protein